MSAISLIHPLYSRSAAAYFIASSRVIAVRECRLNTLRPSIHQFLPANTPDPPLVGVCRSFLFFLAVSITPATIRFADAAGHLPVLKSRPCLVAVIAVVRHHFACLIRDRFMLGMYRFQVRLCGHQRAIDGRGVACMPRGKINRNDGLRFPNPPQLSLVSQMGAAVLPLRGPAIHMIRRQPILV